MIKVFLVEDEYVIREGIKKKIEWEKHGYEFCGEASDGELAYPMIQKANPDIVLTDIRMPFMDGLELSRLIKSNMPWVEIVILSGFQEFEYAKAGIEIGIAKYLLKPINGTELLLELDSIKEKIEEQRKERESREKYKREMEENLLQEKRNLFQSLVTGNKTVAELLEMGKKVDVDLSSMWYNIILLKVQAVNQAYDEYSQVLVEIEQKLNKQEEKVAWCIFDRNLDGKAFLIKADTQEELEQIERKAISHIQNLLEDYTDISYFGGVGVPVNRLRELPNSFEHASHAFAHRYLMKKSMILRSEELDKGIAGEEQEFNIKTIDANQIDRQKIRDFLKRGNIEETCYFVEEFFKGMNNSALLSNIFRQYIVMDCYFCVTGFLEEIQVSKEEIEAIDFEAGVLQNKDDTIKYIICLIQKALELRERFSSNRYGDIIERVKKYIDENYAEEELSLNVAAAQVNFSPNHLSTIFSQETGQSFIKYLTDYRMNIAKELLRCTSKRSSVISLEVGYKDPHYFSYLFKKTQGMTPTQYRGGKNPEGEET